MADHGHFHWNELMTHDPAGAKKFYAETIGWTFDDMEMPDGTYHVAMNGETPVGGIMSGSDFDGGSDRWFAYLAVDDIDARLEKAVAAGAEAVRPAFDIPGIGRIAIIRQPDGALIGWMTPAG